MRILYTDELDASKLSAVDKTYLYNGMDVLIDREVFDVIYPQLDDTTRVTYEFMLGLQAPFLEMMIRGCLIDRKERNRMIDELENKLQFLEDLLNRYALATWGKMFNARSWQQKGEFFYDFAGCREIKKFDPKTGKSKRTTERAAIEKVSMNYLSIRPIAKVVLAIMDTSKDLGTLRSGIDSDGYFRASFNFAGTETGRVASKKNAFGRGSNWQNWREKLRVIFTCPAGPIPDRDQYNIPEREEEK